MTIMLCVKINCCNVSVVPTQIIFISFGRSYESHLFHLLNVMK